MGGSRSLRESTPQGELLDERQPGEQAETPAPSVWLPGDPTRLPSLDGARGAACLAVMLYHFGGMIDPQQPNRAPGDVSRPLQLRAVCLSRACLVTLPRKAWLSNSRAWIISASCSELPGGQHRGLAAASFHLYERHFFGLKRWFSS
jgi:hypothetical protein